MNLKRLLQILMMSSCAYLIQAAPSSGSTNSPGTISLIVEKVIANPQTVGVAQNTTKTITLTASGGTAPYVFVVGSNPSNGKLSGFNAKTGAVTYTPNNNYLGQDSFTFTTIDSLGVACSSAGKITVAVELVVAQAQTVGVVQNTAKVLTLVGSGGTAPYTFALGTSPSNGRLSELNAATGTVKYTPNNNYLGQDLFTFTSTDSLGVVSSSGTVALTVELVAAQAQTVGISQNAAKTITLTASGGVAPYTFALGTSPSNGRLSELNAATGTVKYTPNNNYLGQDSFTFTATDSLGITSSGTITLTVELVVAQLQSIGVVQNTAKVLSLVGSGGIAPYTFTLGTSPSNGSLSAFNSATGSVMYTPNNNYLGQDSFTFTVQDSLGVVSSAGIITLTVELVVAQSQIIGVAQGVAKVITLSGSGGVAPYTFALGVAPLNGTLSGFNPNTGSITYTPNDGYTGSDSFTFVVTDSLGVASPSS